MKSSSSKLQGVLTVDQVKVSYEAKSLALTGVSMQARPGAVTAVVGPNGAGKSTLLKAISGTLVAEGGQITHGEITLGGVRLSGRRPHLVARQGLRHVSEGRRFFRHLTVRENVLVGCRDARRGEVPDRVALVYDYFPALKPRDRAIAGYLSGGEQQMLVLGMALASKPVWMLLDEPSLGLAPTIVESLLLTARQIVEDQGSGIVIVEQNAGVLEIADHVYALSQGAIVAGGDAAEFALSVDLTTTYLGAGR